MVPMVLMIASLSTQEIPSELQGRWIIKRLLPTSTISCWGKKEARQLIGTEIEYTHDSLRWRDRLASHPGVSVSEITADKFHRENSGGGASDSQVTFDQLGIRTPSTTEIVLTHPDIKPIEGAYELPGDTVLIKDNNTIVFSVCNIYFEAKRITPLPSNRK
jgi:hypothetical protein